MPKRDEAYMQSQRHAIVEAAHQVMLERGVRGASLRRICEAAGVSTGALYVHFATLDEVMMAACIRGWDAPEDEEWQLFNEIRTWDDYLVYMRRDVMRLAEAHFLAHHRVVLEAVAELSRRQASSDALATLVGRYRELTLIKLAEFAERGEISLPLGVGATSDMHQQLLHGAFYQAIIDKGLPLDRIADSMVIALAATAGGDMRQE